MLKLSTLPLLFLSLGIFGCRNVKNSENTAVAPVEQSEQGDVSLFASISKSPCYGTCPVYEMKIYSDGKVEYEGKRNVERIGKYIATISEEQMQKFVNVANEINYFKLEDKYDSPITDVPSTTTTLSVNGSAKSVYRRADYPNKILRFEALFEDLFELLVWKKVDD
jgi:hypothetical protein